MCLGQNGKQGRNRWRETVVTMREESISVKTEIPPEENVSISRNSTLHVRMEEK